MTPDFHDRFAAPTDGVPLGLQVLFPEPPELDPDAVATAVRSYHSELARATVELHPAVPGLVPGDGPPPSTVGLLGWADHVVKLITFAAPMPYGPVETCVGPALMDPRLKDEAKAHAAHVLLFYAGTHPDALERYVALAAAAGALGWLGATAVLNEEARAAVPATDLIPDPDEDALHTLRTLPIPYLWAGFVRLDVGEGRPWARTFAAHRLGLPDLAMHLAGYEETSRAFRLFTGLLGYLRESGETFVAGDRVNLGGGDVLRLRAPTDAEWYLESTGTMLVVEPG